jgi:ATP-dependent NAD(P)H-hydrate dehydratase
MVHPLLHSTASAPATSSPSPPSLAAPIIELLPRLHVLVIGPGLGRDKLTHKIISEIITHARERDIPFVLDADGLFLIQSQPDLVKGYKDCILTPNIVEFGRLSKALGVDIGSDPDSKDSCAKLARALGGVTIVQKGKVDIISNGLDEKGGGSAVCDIPGGLKRSGGQGDTLTGSLGTFLAWRQAYHEGLWDGGEKMSREESLLVAAWAGSAITRECSRRAFKKRGRSLQASDLTEEVEGAFLGLVGEPKGDEAKL